MKITMDNTKTTEPESRHLAEILGVAVQLVFAAEKNEQVPVLVREILKSSFSRQQAE